MTASGKKKNEFSYWIVSGFALLIIVLTLVLPSPGEDEQLKTDEKTGDSAGVSTGVDTMGVDTISICILNGTDTDHLAASKADALKSVGDSVFLIHPEISTGNAEVKPYPETVVVSHREDLSAAEFVAHHLNLTGSNIVWEIPTDKSAHSVDVTVYLGEDL